jgi:hypothetical protein
MTGLRVHLVLALVLLVNPSTAFAQAASATLVGTIKDTTGAVLPGVTITAQNSETGEVRTTVTNTDGAYRITNLPRGRYSVTSELSGFKTVRQEGVLLTVGDTVRLDVSLDVGDIAETVEVVSQASLVNTVEGRISYLVDEKRVSELPLNGRNVMQLIDLQPGAVANPGNAVLGGSAGGDTAFVNGQRNRANNFLLDGTDNNDQFTAGRVAVNPSVDTVQEFRIATNTFSAEFGRNSASAVLVVTKSGTNNFDGTAYEFLRNDALDSKTVFASRKDPLKFNQFGGTLGGPLRRGKTFFFASYEGLRLTRGVSLRRTVETPEYRNLVINRLPNSVAAFLFSNFPAPNPTTNIRDTGQPVPGLATDNVLNTPGIATNPNYVRQAGNVYRNAQQAVLDGIPDIGDAFIPVSEKTEANQYSFRIDQDFNAAHRAYGRYTFDKNDADDKQSIPREGFNQPVRTKAQSLTLAHTWILSNATVNEARFGYQRRRRFLTANNRGVPNISFDEGVVAFGNNPTNPAVFEPQTFHWTNNTTVIRGRHALKFGGEIRHVRDNSDFAVRTPGVQFYSIHDFAMDEPRRISILGVNPSTNLIEQNVRNFRFWESGIYLQDDWTLSDRVTVNLGIRHDLFGRPSEKNGLLNNMIPGPGADIFEQVRTATVGRVDQVIPSDYNNVQPRLGFAWDVLGDGKLSVRGGYGIAYERLFNNSITNIRFNPPDYSFTVADPVTVPAHHGLRIFYGPTNPNGTPSGAAVTITGPNPNPGGAAALDIEGNIIGWNGAFGTSQQSLRVPDMFNGDAYSHNWFAGAQYQLGTNMVVEANYVANRGRNYGRLVDYNTVRGDLFDGRLDRLNPGFGGINFRAMISDTEYNGMQLQFTKRYSDGWSAQVSYTLGKSLDMGSDVQVAGFPVDARDLGLEWGPADFDVRHRFVASGLWELPWLRDSTGVTRFVLAGWQINGIVSLQSGFPFNVFTTRTFAAGGDFNGDGVNNDRPNQPSFGLKPPSWDKDDYINGLFRASDFPQTGFILGDLPRNAYRGPGFASVDLSLVKNFQVTAGSRFQFRAEAFNLLNRVNLRNPNGNLAQGTFGRSTQSFAAREIQFGFKYIF